MSSAKYEAVEAMESGMASFEQEGKVESQRKKIPIRELIASIIVVGYIVFMVWVFYPEIFEGPPDKGAFVIMHNHEMLLVREDGLGGEVSWGLPTKASHGYVESYLRKSAAEMTSQSNTSNPGNQVLEFTVEPYKQIYVVRAGSPQIEVDSDDNLSHQWKPVQDVISNLNLNKPLESLIQDKSNRQGLATAFQLTDLEALNLPFSSKVTKLGAGLFLKAEGDILLLRRNSSHNNATLSVPGGNVDLDDEHLRATAEREAVEEMGASPKYKYKGEIDTRRGKHDEKMFKMFLGEMPSELRYNFKPVLDAESLDWGWFPLKSLHKRDDLHPTVRILVRDHAKKVKKIFKE